MSKYTEQFKLRVIKDYLTNATGSWTLSKRYEVDASTVRKWIAAYRVHGEASVKKKHSHYSAQFKLAVLTHMREHALSYRQTAAHFDIRHIGILGSWERQYDAGGLQALSPCPRGRPKKMREPTNSPPEPEAKDLRTRKQLLEELNYLRMENAYLKKLRALIQADQQAALRKKRKSSLS
ncbi:MAG: transposase [Glomeribacter sp. 1016415]|nr:transposase [Glomeribacter sp. 1016415]